MVETYGVKVPSGWMILIPTDLERVCLYDFNKIGLYPDAFHYGIRLPFNPFIKDIFNYFYLAPSQITPNSWMIIRAFEAIYFHVRSHPIAWAFYFFFYIKRGNTDQAYFSKRPEFDNFRMMSGLDDSVLDWKEYFWKVTIDARETRFDFNSSWIGPIHKGELFFKYLGLNDKAMVSKIRKFVLEYLARHGPKYDEFDVEEIVKRYINDEFIFELPTVIVQSEGSSVDIPSCNH